MLELGAALGQLELRVGALEGSSVAAAQKGGGVKSKGGKRGGRDTNAGGEGNCPTQIRRILFVHGYIQDAKIFRSRAGSLRKTLKAARAEFVFVEAPHVLGQNQGGGRAWYTLPKAEATEGLRPVQCEAPMGWAQSRTLLEQTLDGQPAASWLGVVGFSQGAVAASLLCAARPDAFKWAILVAVRAEACCCPPV